MLPMNNVYLVADGQIVFSHLPSSLTWRCNVLELKHGFINGLLPFPCWYSTLFGYDPIQFSNHLLRIQIYVLDGKLSCFT